MRNDPQIASLMAAASASDTQDALQSSLGRAATGTDPVVLLRLTSVVSVPAGVILKIVPRLFAPPADVVPLSKTAG